MKINEIVTDARIKLEALESLPAELPELVFEYAENLDMTVATDKKLGSVSVSSEGNTRRYVVSLGEKEKVQPDTYRKASASFARWCISHNLQKIGCDLSLPQFSGDDQILRALLEGFCIGGFKFDRYITRNKKDRQKVSIYIKSYSALPKLDSEIKRASILGEAVDLARDWIHEPGNVINPQLMEDRIRVLAQAYGLGCQIIEYPELVSMGAGGIAAVGQGSSAKPRLIIVEYHGNGNASPISLVGKAITFDTGGYSLKGAEFIQGMKYDKAGGISVLAVLVAASRLQMKVNLVAVIPTAENMISSEAYRPDDILTLLSGHTVEIVSTDAEGRLILADALAYTQKEHKPKTILDMATLTGGVKIALGSLRAGLLSNSDELAYAICAVGETTGEKVWRLPMDDEYFDLLKSDDADMKNSGSREAQTIVGATFLKQSVSDKIPWAHLDIAAVGDTDKEKPWCGKGPTGFGIRLLLETIERIK